MPLLRFSFLWLLLVSTSYAQQFSVKGTVTEAGTGEPIASATISDSTKRPIATTNQFGYYSFVANKTWSQFYVSAIGYESQSVAVPTSGGALNIVLQLPTLQEVEIKASYQRSLLTNQVTLTPTGLSKLPSVGGERDLLKAIGTFAGVAVGSELSSGINVRGGSNDQNLFYLDGAPVYSTGHLFGFLSIFNPDAIQRVQFHKGDFPVEFGGRLSSITEVAFREGNKNRWEGKAEVGVISSKLLVEGPLIPNKTSIILTARSAYLNLFNLGKKQAVIDRRAENYFGYNFYDLNLKISHSFNANNKLFLSYYQGVDNYETLLNGVLGLTRNQNQRFLSNQLLSLRSYHALGTRSFLQFGVHSTRYAYKFLEDNTQFSSTTTQQNPLLQPRVIYTAVEQIANKSKGQIQDISTNALADFTFNNILKIKTGAEVIRHIYKPVSYTFQQMGRDSVQLNESTQTATESGVFAGLLVNLTTKWQFNAGARYSFFNSESVHYKGLEPRFSLLFQTKHQLLQLSVNRMIQYNHALLRGGELVDKVTWVPSTGRILPQSALQGSLGWSHTLSQAAINYSLSAYYKTMQNLSMYQYFLNSPYIYYNWSENTLSSGEGQAYGFELTTEKTLKNWDFKLNYTLSWSKRRFEELNNGKWFNDLFDRRHNFNFNMVWIINKSTQLSLLWLYYSGQRYDQPPGRILPNPFTAEYITYGGMNEGKLPDYHRLDVGLSKKFYSSKARFWEINFNIYNLYSRQNTYRLFPAVEVIVDEQKRPIERRNVMKSASLFPILPSVNITYKFR